MEIDLKRIIDQVCKDKGLKRETVIEALEKALVTAARRKFGLEREIEAQYNETTGEIELFEFKVVVQEETGVKLVTQMEMLLVVGVVIILPLVVLVAPMEMLGEFHQVQEGLTEVEVVLVKQEAPMVLDMVVMDQ